MRAAPRRDRGTVGAVTAAALLLVWAAAWWATRGTAAATAVSSVGLPVLAGCAAAAGVQRSRRVTGVDRHLWRWTALTCAGWGLTLHSALGRPWEAGGADAQTASPVTAVLLGVTALLAVIALAPVLRSSVTLAGLARDALDNLLLTAAAATVVWHLVLAPAPRTGGVGPLPAALAATLCVELLLAVSFVHLAARTHRRHPGLGVVAAGVVGVVGAGIAAAVLADTGHWPGYDALTWCCAAMACAVVAGAGRPAHPDGPGEPDVDSATPGAGLVPCAAALLALVTSVPTALRGADEGAVGAWLHLVVLFLLLIRALLLAHDGDHLTRCLEQRVARRTRDLASEERRFAALVVHSTDVVSVVDVDGVFTYVSPASRRVFDVPAEDLVGSHVAHLLAGPATRALLDAVRTGLETPGSRRQLRVETRRPSGRRLVLDVTLTSLVDDPAVGGVVLNAHDVTEAVALEEELSDQAFSDALTGLANRALLRDRLEHALRGRAGRSSTTVLYLDLDGFKAVNDTLGHGAGDELLVAVAERLRAAVREGDTVARLGGDEFAVLLGDSASVQESERLAQRICDAVRAPFTVRGSEVHVATSVGVASTRNAGLEADHLMQSADLAMYRAKAARQGGFALYEPRMHEQLLDRVQLEADLRRAVEEGQFRVVYQPLVDMGTGGVTGVEALVRWQHPERGLVSPVAFIPAAESSGLIGAIGAHVLREACHQVAAWRTEVPGAEQMRLSVNLSGHQLEDPELVALVTGVLAASGLPATALVLEITESVIVDQDEAVLTTLNALRALGVRLAVDDFGTGYSSLSYLHRLPVDILKIDKSFVDRLSEGGDLSLVDAIISMASTLEMSTVAEGVEHEHQRAALAAQGCGTGQGYHFSPPVDAADIPGLVVDALLAVRTAASAVTAVGATTTEEVAR